MWPGEVCPTDLLRQYPNVRFLSIVEPAASIQEAVRTLADRVITAGGQFAKHTKMADAGDQQDEVALVLLLNGGCGLLSQLHSQSSSQISSRFRTNCVAFFDYTMIKTR